MNGDNLEGKVLGTCRLEKRIGRGGMSIVYLAQQTRPARKVAVKILLPNLGRNQQAQKDFLRRFQQEADVIARLEHINIIPIYEYGEHEQLVCLVMPYINGGNLGQILEKGALPLVQVAHYLDQAAAALDYAHTQGVIHRDLKPSNFLIHADSRLVLADFGIARFMRDSAGGEGDHTLTQAGQVLGTPAYMAPEMIRGEKIDYATDIYELGVVLFQMLSGELPYQGASPFAIFNKHLNAAPPSLHQKNPALPTAVDLIIQRALAKRREERFQSASEMAQALRSTLSSPTYNPISYAPYPPLSTPYSQPGIPPYSVRQLPESSYQQPINQISPMPAAQNTPFVLPEYSAPPLRSSQAGISAQEENVYNNYTVADTTAPPSSFQPPIAPSAPNAQRVRKTSGWFKALPLIILLVVGSMIGWQMFHAFARPNTPIEQAKEVVQRYYDDINNKNYTDAYNLWGDHFHQQVSLQTFSEGYANTEKDTLTIKDAQEQKDGTVIIETTIKAQEKNNNQSVEKTLIWTGVIGKDQGQWKILRASQKQAIRETQNQR